MGFFRRSRAELVPRRAVVVPFDAMNVDDNLNNLSADGRAKTRLRVIVQGDEAPRTVTASIPNWLRIVLYYSGSNEGPAAELPAEVEVPVLVDPRTGAVMELDLDAAAAELSVHREVAERWWKEDEAPLADVRNAAALPKELAREAKGLIGAWRDAATGGDEQTRAAEAEQSRRTANILKHDLARKPKQAGRARASALEAGPLMVANVRSGSMSAADFETWLRFQLGSGAITPAEADDWRDLALERG